MEIWYRVHDYSDKVERVEVDSSTEKFLVIGKNRYMKFRDGGYGQKACFQSESDAWKWLKDRLTELIDKQERSIVRATEEIKDLNSRLSKLPK